MISILGYARADGRPGIRNLVLSVHTVECSSFVSQQIAAMDPRIHALGFPGCYSNAYASRLIVSLATHPNVGAVLLVSLGCEGTDASKLATEIAASGRTVEVLRIQEAGGTEPAVRLGRIIAARLLAELDRTPRVPMELGDLVIGTECGGSDATSGISANPAVGQAFDLLVDAGASVMLEETLEMLGCGEIIAARGCDARVADEIRKAITKAEEFSVRAEQFSIAPGNHAGGLTTIEEKSLGAFVKGGTRPIRGVLKVGQRPSVPGLYLLDSVPDPSPFGFGYSNPNDSEGILALIACGCHMVVFTTGRGSVIGSVISPVLKVCGNPKTYERMSGDMDIDAGRIMTGQASLPEVGAEIVRLIEQTAAGSPTRAEALGHREYCIPYKAQDLCAVSAC